MKSTKLLVGLACIYALLGARLTMAAASDREPTQIGRGKTIYQTAAKSESGQNIERWRYTYHNGEWWYWLPSNRWVYWRCNRWNDYQPETFTYADGARLAYSSSNGWADASSPRNDSDIRPYYGHALSDWDFRPVQPNDQTGPFYGHALPNEVFGPWTGRRSIRPYYGHAISSYGY